MSSHIDLVDMNYVRMAQDWARRMGSPRAEMNFAALKARIDRIRSENGLHRSERSTAVLARDFDNQRQGRVADAVEASGFTSVWQVDYRHTYVSRTEDDPRSLDPAQSLSHYLTYGCGLAAASESRSVVLVTGAFELAGPLDNFVRREGTGHAVLAYFQRLLDKRWLDNGLLDGRLGIQFVNLERFGMELLGADLRELSRQSEAARQGTSLPL